MVETTQDNFQINLGVMLSRRISWKIYGVGFKYYVAMDGKLTVYPDLISCLKLSWLLGRLVSLGPLTLQSNLSRFQKFPGYFMVNRSTMQS
ncbi:uncharacterized protein LOC18095062 isoform X3 [Populus trichocarpa]|uniref:uncharacterized protein LOC18095062 isoform X3 n=1 Tax=Populus trichocarpa TaxID=3694 RepID=UPI002278AEA8|nr:uncharacterized protein LOC18095062 isoform X3 [Populus trichocarpa]